LNSLDNENQTMKIVWFNKTSLLLYYVVRVLLTSTYSVVVTQRCCLRRWYYIIIIVVYRRCSCVTFSSSAPRHQRHHSRAMTCSVPCILGDMLWIRVNTNWKITWVIRVECSAMEYYVNDPRYELGICNLRVENVS